jgi:hypothetical protein
LAVVVEEQIRAAVVVLADLELVRCRLTSVLRSLSPSEQVALVVPLVEITAARLVTHLCFLQ